MDTTGTRIVRGGTHPPQPKTAGTTGTICWPGGHSSLNNSSETLQERRENAPLDFVTVKIFALAAVLALLVLPSVASAQGKGVLSGTVADQTGGVLPGTSVTITPSGGKLLETVTDDTGRYRFENL